MGIAIRVGIALSLVLAVGCEKSSSRESTSSATAEPRAKVWVSRQALERASDDQLQNLLMMCLNNITRAEGEREYQIVRTWTPGKRMLYTTWVLESEVNNGGFEQFFSNTRDQASDMALEGLKLIGAEAHAGLLERAIAIRRQSPGDGSALKAIDEEFFKLSEELGALRVKHIRAHMDEFATPS